MVASITLPSGTLPELSNAIFASSGNDQMVSLFDALMAAITQADDHQEQTAPTPNGTEPAAAPVIAASLFPSSPIEVPDLVLPAEIVPNGEPLKTEQESGQTTPNFRAAAVHSPLNVLLLPPDALETISALAPASLPQAASAFEPVAPTNEIEPAIAPAEATATPPQVSNQSSQPVSSSAQTDPEKTAAKNPLPAEVRLALANVPGAPALIVRNLVLAQLLPQAQGDEHAAIPVASEHPAQEQGSTAAALPAAADIPAPQNEPAPSPIQGLASLQLSAPDAESTALPQPTVATTIAPPALQPASLPVTAPTSTAISPQPTALADDKRDESSDNETVVALATLAPIPIVPTAPMVAEQTPAPQGDTASDSTIDPDATSPPPASAGGTELPLAESSALPNVNPAPGDPEDVEKPAETASTNGQTGTVAAAPRQIPPGLRIAPLASQRGKHTGLSEIVLPRLEQASAPTNTTAAPASNAKPVAKGDNPQPQSPAPDATPPSSEPAATADFSQSTPKEKPVPASAPSAPEQHAIAAPSAPASVQPAIDTASTATAHPTPEAPLAAVGFSSAPAPSATDTPVRVPLMALAGWPDSAMLDALALKIAAKSSNGDSSFQIRLDPPELGHIEVNLNVDSSGNAQASLTADKPQTLDLLQRDSSVLERALKDAGLDLTGGLSFSLKGEARSGPWRDGQNGRTRMLSIDAIEASVAGSVTAAMPIPQQYGANGRLDITV